MGSALAYLSIDWLSAALHNLDNPPPSWITFDVDALVLSVTVGATMIAAIASGLLPAWISSRADTNAVLRDGGRGSTSRSINVISRGLVVFQIVVTCVLLIGSLLQARSILKQQTIDYGYDTDGILSARMGLMDGDYPSQDSRKLFYDRLLRTLRTDPEFDGAALTNRFRMVFSGNGPIEIDGKEYKEDRDRPKANSEQVTGGFFGVTGQKLLEGRTFTDEDLDSRQPVSIVNAAFAVRHFGNASALGRRFRTVNPNGTQPGPWRTIVGVVSTIRMLGPFNNPGVDDTGFYVPFFSTTNGPALSAPFVSQFATVIVKPHPGQRADALIATLRREIARADPNLPLYFVGTPKVQLDVFVAQNRIVAVMFSIFGVVAVVSGVGRHLRRHVVLGQPARPGVRRAHGARRRRCPHPRDGTETGRRADCGRPDARRRTGAGICRSGGERDSEHSIRRQRTRPANLRRGDGADCRGIADRYARPRAARDPRRPDDGAPRRLTCAAFRVRLKPDTTGTDARFGFSQTLPVRM